MPTPSNPDALPDVPDTEPLSEAIANELAHLQTTLPAQAPDAEAPEDEDIPTDPDR